MKEKFSYYNPNPAGRTDANDCVVRALAFFFGVTWMKAFFDIATWCANQGLVRFNYRSAYNAYLKETGYERRRPPDKGISVGQFRDEYAEEGRIYIVSTPRHLSVVSDKTLFDIGDCSNMAMDGYWIR